MESNEAPSESNDDETVEPAVEPTVEPDAPLDCVAEAEPALHTGVEPEESEPAESEPAESEPALSAVVANTCSAMLDAVAMIDRIEARQDAWKVEFIDQARRIAETTEHGLITVGSTLTETQRREMVRRSFVAEVACVLSIPEVTAGQLVDDSAVLMSRLPATLAALREGEVSLRHARVIVDQVSTLDDTTALSLEEAAIPYAKTLTVSRFRQKARILRERIDAESITERRKKSARDRRIEFIPAPDGMAWLSLYTTAPEATALYTAIRSAAMKLQSKDEERSLAQLGADVSADALAAGLANGGTRLPVPVPAPSTAFERIEPTVVVTVPFLTLMGKSEEPGNLVGYGPIDPGTARKLAGKSKGWYRLLTDPENGAPLSLGRTKYKPSKHMRLYLQLRGARCDFKGCNRQATHCEIDHTHAWAFGGPTDCDNLSHLCPKHHRLKHQTTWQPKQLGGGTIRWTSPDGRTYVTEPESSFLPPPKAVLDPKPPPATAPPLKLDELPPF